MSEFYGSELSCEVLIHSVEIGNTLPGDYEPLRQRVFLSWR